MVCWWMVTVLALVQGVEVAERVSRRVRPGRGSHRSTRPAGPRSMMRSWDAAPRPRPGGEDTDDTSGADERR